MPEHLAWVKKNAVKFKTIDPNETDFSDLQPLKDIIGAAQIVQLGEQTHGDGSCFSTKIRLIKFLHEEMEFDVLAFESGLYDCQRAWQSFKKGEPGLEAARQGVFGIWTGSKQTGPLWDYLARQSRTLQPLELVGFDCQYTASASREYLVDDVKKLIEVEQLEIDEKQLRIFDNQLKKLIDGGTPFGSKQSFDATIGSLRNQIQGRIAQNDIPSPQCLYWNQQLKSIKAHADYLWDREEKREQWSGVNHRDAQMADNLSWLANEKHRDQKIIVWAASFHIARNLPLMEVPSGTIDYSAVIQMGQLVQQNFADRVFTIGFTAYQGRAGIVNRKSWNIGTAPAGTLEDICHRAGIENGLLPLNQTDISGQWLRDKLFSRPLGYSWMKASWPNHFDAMIYNHQMNPSTN